MTSNMLFDLGSEEKKAGPVSYLGLELDNEGVRRAAIDNPIRRKTAVNRVCWQSANSGRSTSYRLFENLM